jgi:hypothetical protein
VADTVEAIFEYAGGYTLSREKRDEERLPYAYKLIVPGLRQVLKGAGMSPWSAFIRLTASVEEYAPDRLRTRGILSKHVKSGQDEGLLRSMREHQVGQQTE